MNKNRPRYLALYQIRLPLPGWISILHRISGALLFLALPLFLWMLQQSLSSPEAHATVAAVLEHPALKTFLTLMLWAFLHHICAGIRFLVIDLDVGVALAPARAGSKWVLFVSLVLTILLGARLW